MKIFISSVIAGFEELRDSAAGAIGALGHVPVRAEDFPASADSSQTACLAGVRESDLVVLIMGERYGFRQASGLSATHEEYREARNARPVLVLIQDGVTPDVDQATFIAEVQGWEHGHYTASFKDADELRDRVIRALHEYTLATASAPLNETELLNDARELLSPVRGVSRATLLLSVSPGPKRAVLRPAELEAPELQRFVLSEALTGGDAVLTVSAGTEALLQGDALELRQRESGGLVRLDETGRILVAAPLSTGDRMITSVPSIIEEDVAAAIERGLRFTARVLDRIDGPKRLTHVATVAAVAGAGYLAWRTREEQRRNPSTARMSMRSNDEIVVGLTPPVRRRAALVHEAQQLAEDLTVKLRREFG